MLDGGKKVSTLVIPHIIVFHMEEYGLTEVQVRRKYQWGSTDYDRHVVRLYFMRRMYALDHEKRGLKEFAGPIW
jgi:hypothetical protein